MIFAMIFLVSLNFSVTNGSDLIESGPIELYEIRNSFIASMLWVGINDTDALFR